METSFLIVGSVALWAYLASRTTNEWLKQYMFLTSILLTTGMAWIGWLSLDQTEIIALNVWRYTFGVLFLGWIGLYGGLWITGALEKEEIDNGF